MSSKEIANIIKKIIDDYWAIEISKDQAINKIKKLMQDRENRIKVYRGDKQTAVFSRIMGIRRLVVFDELYNKDEVK